MITGISFIRRISLHTRIRWEGGGGPGLSGFSVELDCNAIKKTTPEPSARPTASLSKKNGKFDQGGRMKERASTSKKKENVRQRPTATNQCPDAGETSP